MHDIPLLTILLLMDLLVFGIFSQLQDIFQFSSVAQSHPALHGPMDYNTSGLSVPHHLPKFAQVHVRFISDSIQPSHPLLPCSPPALNLSQHQHLFQ